jgi:glucokinase
MLLALIKPLMEKAKENKVKIRGIGLGVAGVIDYQTNTMLHSPNIPIIDNVKLAMELEKRIELPVKMDNDAKCFVRAEALLGGGKNYHSVVGVILGTGIGSGLWLDNETYHGSFGGAGEIGEMIVDFEKEISLEEAYHRLMQNNPASIAEEAYRGDVLSEKIYEEFGRILGIAFANVVNVVDPEVFIIGGGAVESSDLFFAEVKKYMVKHIESSVSAKKVKIQKSKLGKNAGAIGAALLIV